MRLYNTLTKKQENLVPLQAGKVGMYVCGPTVYASPHIGNARSVVIYDLLFRVLKAKYDVTYVRNITDVDDKINIAAKERGITIQKLTGEVEADFNSAMQALGCLQPTHTPRATEHIAEMVAMIERLIASGHAYAAEGHVLFDVNSDPKYGHLSNRSLDEMVAGARVEVAPYKKNAADFVLWKPAAGTDDESAKFQSPWGVGRPGWHIECSAMSIEYLCKGKADKTFDIHGGGVDLVFPHHENEVAQSTCAHPHSEYAKMWVHNGFLTVNGDKMSKSLGNFITVRELLDKGINGEVIRWALLSTHYRGQLDWNDKLLYDAKNTVDKYYRIYESMEPEFWDDNHPNYSAEVYQNFSDDITQYLNDDLNVSKTFAYLNDLVVEGNSNNKFAAEELLMHLKFLGFMRQTPDEYFGRVGGNTEIEALIEARKAAKAAKNWAEADKIRAQLTEMNIVIEDKPGGVTEWRKI